jgi:hypothetical protein
MSHHTFLGLVLALLFLGLACATSTDPSDAVPAGPTAVPDTCSNMPGGALFRRPELPKPAAANRWDLNPRRLNVQFVDGDDAWGREVRDVIKATVREWEAYADLRFDFDPGTPGQITVRLTPDAKYPVGIFQSRLGKESLDERPSMYLIFGRGSPRNKMRQRILHEFGHALGLMHELQRPDIVIHWKPEKVYAYYRYYNWPKEWIKEQVMDSYQLGILARSPFDQRSIMTYPIPPGLADVEMTGWSDALSPMDKSFIARLYPVYRTDPPVEILLEGKTLDGEIPEPGQAAWYRVRARAKRWYRIEATGDMPVLMGLYGSAVVGSPTGTAACEGKGAVLLAELDPGNVPAQGVQPGTYYLDVRHQRPKEGKGRFRITFQPSAPPPGR